MKYFIAFMFTSIGIVFLSCYSMSNPLLPKDVILPLNTIISFFPGATQVSAGHNDTAIGKPEATRKVIYSNNDHSKKITISVDQYNNSNDALSAYKKAVQKSKSVSGFKPISIPKHMNELAFAGTVTQNGEIHIGLGMLENNLIIGATLAGYDVTPSNINNLVSLVRQESNLTKIKLGHSKNEFQPRFESADCPKISDPEQVKALANARCGFLIVPENRNKNNGRTIRLAIAILPALSKHPEKDPIIHLSGGPGGSAIQEAKYIVHSGLNQTRDVILLAQRGTFYSEPALTCPEIDEFNAHAVGLKYDADLTKRLHVAATQACYNRLIAKGIDLNAYNTTENAADVASLRIALNIPQWNVYAYSYGTYLALNLMRQYPEGIRSVILDSVAPPDIASPSWTWSSAHEGFTNLFNDCAADRDCNAHFPNLSNMFAELINKFESKPLITYSQFSKNQKPVKISIDGGSLVNWLVGAQPPLTTIPAAIKELSQGNPKRIALARAMVADPTFIGEFGHGLAFGVFCSEWIPYEDSSHILKQGKKVFPNFPDSVLSQPPQLPFITDDCRVWKVSKASPKVRSITKSAIPTLILSGNFDARTGAHWGAYVSRNLKNSTNIVIPGVGHWVTIKSSCAQSIIDSFLSNPISPNIECATHLKSPPFKFMNE